MQKKLQVFVSSTFTDLIDERQAAVSAILKSGHIPAGMELFTAGDQSQMDVIRRWIDDSDIYMLILGGRYGSVEKSTGLSYTELEFDYAVAKSKPLFSIVANQDVIDQKIKLIGAAAVETENAAAYRHFKEKVLSNVSSFYTDEKDVRLAVYESLGDISAREDLVGWMRADELDKFKIQTGEMERLKSENESLRRSIQESPRKQVLDADAFRELGTTLAQIQVKLPEEVRLTPEDSERDLLSLFVNNRDRFVAGVGDSPLNNAISNFLFYNVATKLKVHGLVGEKKLTGKKFSALATTQLGDKFLAWVDKRMIDSKKKED